MVACHRLAALSGLLAAALLLNAGCGGGGASGSVRVDGSSTVFPITEAVAEEFMKENRGARVTVGVSGTVRVEGQDLYDGADPVLARRRIGMVFQKPNPFPKSIRQNVLWGAQVNGLGGDEEERLERALRQAPLWDEVKDRLSASAYGLSGGQQQRLCIARALAVEPDVLLMDEPTSALDPRVAGEVEDTIAELKERYTVAVVTHNMQQARRVSDATAFLYLGRLVETTARPTCLTRRSRSARPTTSAAGSGSSAGSRRGGAAAYVRLEEKTKTKNGRRFSHYHVGAWAGAARLRLRHASSESN